MYLWQSHGINPEELDWHWQDGWELMWLNLGWYPDNNTTISINPAHETSPYFVLYNRYTGKLRFFGNHFQQLGISSTAQNVDLRIHMSSHNKSGIFRHIGNYDQALDKETKYEDLHSNNEHPNSNRRFYSTDFQLGYDPCVCNYESALTFKVQENANWNVNLTGRSITMNGSINDYPPDFLTNRSWYKDSLTADFGGSLIYKNFSSLNDKYEADLAAYEDKLATYNKPQNIIARELISLSKTLAVNGVTGAFLPTQAVKDEVFKFMKKIDNNFDKNNSDQMAMGIRKTADALIGKGVDYLVKQYINPDILSKPIKPTMPTATFSEMVIGGSITHSKEYDLFTSSSPGSFNVATNNLNVFNYPIYNKPTGLYALLKTPKIALGSKQSNDSVISFFHGAITLGDWVHTAPQIGGVTFLVSTRIGLADFILSHTTTQDIVFHLDEELLYKLNRNLDINDDKSSMLVSFQLELKGQLPSKFHSANSQLGERRLEVTLANSNFEILNHETQVSSSEPEKLLLEIPWDKIEKVAKNIYSVKLNLTAFYKIRQDVYKEVRSMNPHTFEITRTNTLTEGSLNNDLVTTKPEIKPKSLNRELHYSIKSLKMKVMTDLTFNQISSKGGEINTTQVFTYLLYDKDKNIDLIASNGRWLNASETNELAKSVTFPPTLTLGTQVLTPQSSEVSFVEGNTLYVRANEIYVNGALTVATGYNAVLFATDRASILAGGQVGSRITLKLGDKFERFYYKPPTKEATLEQVNSFCSANNEYKANQSSALILPFSTHPNNEDEGGAQSTSFQDTPLIWDWNLYPNPNNGVFTLSFGHELRRESTLRIFDLMGRLMHESQLQAGTNSYFIQTDNLTSGMYIVNLQQGGEKRSLRMSVIKE